MPGAFLFSRRAVAGRHRRPRLRRHPRPAAQRRRGHPRQAARGPRRRAAGLRPRPGRRRRARRARWPSSSPPAGAPARRRRPDKAAPGEARERSSATLGARPRARRRARSPASEARPAGRQGFSPDLEDRVRGALGPGACAAAWWPTRTCCSRTACAASPCATSATGTERVHFDLFDHLGYPGEARDFFESEVRGWSGYTREQRRLLVDLLLENLPPNLLLNRSETLVRQEAAAAAVGQVFNQIRKGQVIVRKGDLIDPADARIIAQMRGERQLRAAPAAARRHPGAARASPPSPSGSPSAASGWRTTAGAAVLRRACCCSCSRCWGRSSASWWPTPSPAPSRPRP